MQTIVIGHRNPDMDAICSAIGYGELKRRLGTPNILVARAGNTNPRIDFVLQKFGIPSPEFVEDVTPKVADLMERKLMSVRHHSTIHKAINSFEQKRLRGLPVVDDENRCLGLLSGWKITNHLFPPQEETGQYRRIKTSTANVVEALDGQILVGRADDEERELILMVAAMSLESLLGRFQQYDSRALVLFVGDREDVQLAAIKAGLRTLVITGDLGVPADVRQAAKEAGACLISSRFDTATTVSLARSGVAVDGFVDPNFTSFTPETTLQAARKIAAAAPDFFFFPVLDGNKRLVGMLTKSDFLLPSPRELILVDHNEMSQAVRGADEVPIIEVLDHHRLGNLRTDTPILFWNNPVGSTSTIVTLCYRQFGIPIPPPIAGLLMAGLISDTLNMTSPTATPIDADVMQELSKVAGVEPNKLAEEIFAVGSPLLTLTPKDAIVADCKDYEETGVRFSVSQVEELSFQHFEDKQETLFAALEEYRDRRKDFFSALLVTDVNTQNSRLLIAAPPEFQNVIQYPKLGPNLFELNHIVSRKKQLIPYLLGCLQQVSPKS
ncbi:MAG: putative manganese-dependent inorganic diphosphatase [Verrucomicrobia bacterium]|nr:putative manganese-dependent inorganic diphosphatase [Verrucomicrobiota bacterium]MBV9273348.1 putative manganese-dependent inorganic diphosphatase [Verrucomicrobiota bacterium]